MGEGAQSAAEPSAHGESIWAQVGRGAWVVLAFGAAFASAFTYWTAFLGEFGPLIALLTWPILGWGLVLIHEMGHAVAAWLCGWRVIAFAAGPIGFHLVNGDWSIIPRSKRAEFEGFVLPLPGNADVWTLRRDALIDAAGPLANLVVAVTAFAIAPAFAGGSEQKETIDWGLILTAIGLMSLFVTFNSLLPHPDPDSRTDGQNMMAALRADHGEWLQYRAIALLFGLLAYQLRLRDLPLWLLDETRERAADGIDGVQRAYDIMAIGMVLDCPPVDIDQARGLLEEHRQRYGESAWLNSCDAYFSAVWEGDAMKARSLLWRGESEPEIIPLTLAAEAAVLAREGDGVAARALLQQMHSTNREQSIFPDRTFRDIGLQIRAILPA